MHPYLRRTDTSNGFEMAWALCASLIFHVLLVLTLTSSSIYYPVTGPETRFDVIWATPSALPREPTATAEVKPLRNPPGLQQETATLEPQLPQNGPPPASPPPASGDEVQNERAAGEISQDLEVFTVLAKAPTLSEAAPAAVKTVALSRRDLTQKREPVSVRHRQQTPQTAEMALEEQPPPAPIPASPAKNDPRPLAQLQDGPELTPQRNPARLNLPRAKKEPDLQVPQVQISRDGDDESQQSARRTDTTVMPPEAKRGKSSPEQDVPLPDAEIPAPLTAQKERIRAAERENADGQHAERERRSRQARLVQEHEKQKRQAARLKAEEEKRERERVAQEQHAARLKTEGEKKKRVRIARAAGLVQEQREQEQQTARLKTEGKKKERERVARAARLVQEQREQEQHAARLKAEGEKRVSVEAASKPLPLGRQEYAAAKSPGDQNLPAPEGVRAGKTAVAIGKVTEPAPPGTLSQSASKPAEKLARGLVIAVLHGDLKLVMTGDTGIKVTVKFSLLLTNARTSVTRA